MSPPTLLATLVDTSQRVGEHAGRRAKITHIAEFLRSLSADEVDIGVSWLAGLTRQGRSGIGYALLRDARSEDGAAVAELPERVAASLQPGTLCIGDGATRYRSLLEEAGGVVPPGDDVRHAPGTQALSGLAAGGAPEPVYVRRPDAEPRVA